MTILRNNQTATNFLPEKVGKYFGTEIWRIVTGPRSRYGIGPRDTARRMVMRGSGFNDLDELLDYLDWKHNRI